MDKSGKVAFLGGSVFIWLISTLNILGEIDEGCGFGSVRSLDIVEYFQIGTLLVLTTIMLVGQIIIWKRK
jgi:hypothetical protein